MLRDEVADGFGELETLGAGQTIVDVIYDHAGALDRRHGVVRALTILILSEKRRIVDFTDVVVERSGPYELHVGADVMGGFSG